MARETRLPLLLALFCALFLRALVPTGWMPAPTGGPFAMEPCPSVEPVAMAMAAGAMAKHDGTGHRDQHNGDCAYSPFHKGSTPSLGLAAPPPPLAAATTFSRFFAVPALTTGPSALPPPSTGPPETA